MNLKYTVSLESHWKVDGPETAGQIQRRLRKTDMSERRTAGEKLWENGVQSTVKHGVVESCLQLDQHVRGSSKGIL